MKSKFETDLSGFAFFTGFCLIFAVIFEAILSLVRLISPPAPPAPPARKRSPYELSEAEERRMWEKWGHVYSGPMRVHDDCERPIAPPPPPATKKDPWS